MSIVLVSIGEELLRGQTVNTNVAFLGKQLTLEGYRVVQQVTLADEREGMKQGFEQAWHHADMVIATGGLGPTLDDITRSVAAELFDCGFRKDAAVEADLRARYVKNYFAVEDQVMVPQKAQVLINRVGSAPGLVFCEKGKWLILLPGVPKEMTALFLEGVLPLLKQRYPGKQRARRLLHFCLVYESIIDPHLRTLSQIYPKVDVGIYPGDGTLSISLAGVSESEVDRFAQALLAQFGVYAYEAPSGTIAESLLLTCRKQGKTIAFAESCSGGQMASAITAIGGASESFLGSIVVYSNALKQELLGVSEETLRTHGAVSHETVTEMLKGVFLRTSADVGVAISGIAGPGGGSHDKPVGTIYAAVGERGHRPDVGHFFISGDRQKIIHTSSQYLLGALWRKMEKGVSAFPLLSYV